MGELVLNNKRLKLIDGEIYAWKPIKNPFWRKIKYNINEDGYYCFNLRHNYILKNYKVHRVIYKLNNPDWDMTYTRDNEIDHYDNNKSNNNIENLRVVSRSENLQNIITTKGYTWCKKLNKYKAQIKINKKNHNLGCYDTPEEAREAYLIAKKKYHIDCYL